MMNDIRKGVKWHISNQRFIVLHRNARSVQILQGLWWLFQSWTMILIWGWVALFVNDNAPYQHEFLYCFSFQLLILYKSTKPTFFFYTMQMAHQRKRLRTRSVTLSFRLKMFCIRIQYDHHVLETFFGHASEFMDWTDLCPITDGVNERKLEGLSEPDCFSWVTVWLCSNPNLNYDMVLDTTYRKLACYVLQNCPFSAHWIIQEHLFHFHVRKEPLSAYLPS